MERYERECDGQVILDNCTEQRYFSVEYIKKVFDAVAANAAVGLGNPFCLQCGLFIGCGNQEAHNPFCPAPGNPISGCECHQALISECPVHGPIIKRLAEMFPISERKAEELPDLSYRTVTP